MAPQRPRIAPEDSRSDASSTKERQIAALPTKPRRNGNTAVASRGSHLRDVIVATTTLNVERDTQQDAHDASGTINWSNVDLSVLRAYRQAHRLNSPSAFSSSYNQRILSRPGVGWSSPTMGLHKDRRRVSKESLALAVRKDFKDAMVQESEAITSFLYSVHNQDKDFRTRFAPSRAK